MSNAWSNNFSSTVKNFRASPTKEIFAALNQPGMISFAGGLPAPEVFPVDKFYEGAHLLKDDAVNLLQYGTTEGDSGLREFIAEFCSKRLGKKIDMTEIILTSGAQQAIDLFAWVMIDQGDIVITEDPSFMAAFSCFHNHGAQIIGVPCDAEGMQVDLLPAIIEKAKSEGKKIKFIYTIENFQNPCGATMSVERRKRLAQISAKYELPIFEDDPYGFVRFEGEELPAIFSFDLHDGEVGNCVYVGSFSKILAPGTRIGWAIGNKDVIKKMATFKQSTDLCSCSISQSLTLEYCQKGYLQQHLSVIIDNYKHKRDAMEESMKKHLTPLGVTWTKPHGGFFFWIDVPGVDTSELLKKAMDKKVVFVAGAACCTNPAEGKNKARLNYTYSSPETIEEGIKRLADAIKELK